MGDKHTDFSSRVNAGEDAGAVLDSMGIRRYCCRRMLLMNLDIIDQILPYYEALAHRQEEFETGRT